MNSCNVACCLALATGLLGQQRDAASEHWAFAPIRAADLPAGVDPIDHFVARAREARGLRASPHADPATLLRRVSLDLTGLPPTLDEVQAFAADPSPAAYERAVDRLLASPHYGEHQAVWWLDLARYADTKGYEKDARRPGIWRWRQWVIEAFNRDVPFDEFTLLQLAGDLLTEAERAALGIDEDEALLATAFHRNTMTNDEGGTDNEEFRVAAVVDRVNTTMTAWNGLTLACAQCHDHKYDPFSMRDYYGLYAFFDNTADADRNNEAPTRHFPSAEQLEEQAELRAERRAVEADSKLDADAKKARLDELDKALRRAAGPVVPILQELRDEHRRTTRILLRGSFLSPGEPVVPAFPPALPGPADGADPDRRSLARWLTSDAHPLTARVMVNRLWSRIFGRGLVVTEEDFGTQGTPPSHPELLDALAHAWRTEGAWSIKALLRRIVLSDTYRQASTFNAAAAAADPTNTWLWRGPRTALTAEMVRDQALAVSGLLHRAVGGPSVMPPQPDGIWQIVYSNDRWREATGPERYRRALYTFWRRTSPHPLMESFDAPSRDVCVVRRIPTSTPLQALASLNDEGQFEAAQALGRHMVAAGDGPEQRWAAGFRRVLLREPSAAESARGARLWSELDEALRELEPEAVARLATEPLGPLADGMDAREHALWALAAQVLLNLDAALTRR